MQEINQSPRNNPITSEVILSVNKGLLFNVLSHLEFITMNGLFEENKVNSYFNLVSNNKINRCRLILANHTNMYLCK